MGIMRRVVYQIQGDHQISVAQTHLSNLKSQFFVSRDLVERVKRTPPRQAGMDRCCDQPGILSAL
jgi:hypothetical protein